KSARRNDRQDRDARDREGQDHAGARDAENRRSVLGEACQNGGETEERRDVRDPADEEREPRPERRFGPDVRASIDAEATAERGVAERDRQERESREQVRNGTGRPRNLRRQLPGCDEDTDLDDAVDSEREER